MPRQTAAVLGPLAKASANKAGCSSIYDCIAEKPLAVSNLIHTFDCFAWNIESLNKLCGEWVSSTAASVAVLVHSCLESLNSKLRSSTIVIDPESAIMLLSLVPMCYIQLRLHVNVHSRPEYIHRFAHSLVMFFHNFLVLKASCRS